MADTTLLDFVREALAKGESRERISSALQQAGWPDDQIEDALGAYADIDFAAPVPRPRRYGGAREAFLYIVYFALLGMVAFQVGGLAFAYIDKLVADPLYSDQWRYAASRLRWSVSALVVGYPIFLYLGWRLASMRRRNSERRASRVRSWLTYITLIFAALTLIGDLVAVVYNFLGGEMSVRFVMKAIVVGAISGAILWNYTRDAERTAAGVDWPGRILAALATLVTAALVVWAFTLVDTPGAARAQALDEQRLAHLQTIARRVDCYRTYFGETPVSLDAMGAALDERAGRQPAAYGCAVKTPDDPATNTQYAYAQLDGDGFRLCAVFDRGWPKQEEGDDNAGVRSANNRRTFNKPQTAGETCFDLEAIDFEPDDEEGEK